MESPGNIWFKGPNVPGLGAGSADNGLSFDVAMGKIVLGNDVGAPGDPAQLLSIREILENLFAIILKRNALTQLRIDAESLTFDRDYTDGPTSIIMQDSTGNFALYRMDPGSNVFNILVDFAGGAHGELVIDDNGRVILAGNLSRTVGHSLQLGSGGGLVANGGTQLWRQMNIETANRVINSGEAYYVFTNAGAAAGITLTLPNCAAGQVFEFYVANANGITITAQAGQSIRIGDMVTGGGGSINSVVVGSYIKLTATDDSTGFIASGVVGNWTSGTNRRVGEIAFSTLTATAALNFPNTLAQTSQDLTIAVAGAADGDVVLLGVPNASVLADSDYSAWVSAAGTVTVRFNNYSAGAQDPANGTFRVTVLKY